jgi:hypothetical protein
MTTVSVRALLVATVVSAATAWGQAARKEPYIGYVYPAGGQRGTTFDVLVGGQQLAGAGGVYISGTGVHASVIQHYAPIRNLKKEEREAIQRRMKELIQARLTELPGDARGPLPFGGRFARNRWNANRPPATQKAGGAKADAVELPQHPLLRDLENKSLRELLHVRKELLDLKKKQPNAQIAESVLIEITIDPNAAPGDREIRLKTPRGLTNPICFQVGLLPETSVLLIDDSPPLPVLPKEPPLSLPVLVNGQVKPGNVDRFRFLARQGQKLVIEAWARHLIPYLADAVPGWFQATLVLYDAKGNEVAFADHYGFDPDPILFYNVPQDGEYELEVRDSLYRGREDFVYRVAVGEQPFITQAFPLGGRRGARTIASIDGWNLPDTGLALDTSPGVGTIRQTALREKDWLSNRVTYAVDTLPECNEIESNDSLQNAQRIDLPRIVNGRISPPGDVDVFQFEGRAGGEVVVEVRARRLGSPLDSLLRLTDASGRVLAWNDDHEDPEAGLLTHHADSYIRARLPAGGAYYIHLADSQHHGGPAYGYRLRISAPRPNFGLCMTPSSINVRAGGAAPICVYAVRKDGFDGDIEVVLKDAPAGFTLDGGRIPRGRDRVRMTLTAPRTPLRSPVTLLFEGHARISGATVRRPVVPAEDMMQAFIYRHLVPSQQLMVATIGAGRAAPPVELASDVPVRLPVGSTTRVRIRTPGYPMLRNLHFELSEPPAGVTLEDVAVVPEGLTLVVKAGRDVAQLGLADNLIVEAFAEAPRGQQGAKQQKQRMSLGVLPAIPFEVVQR